MRRVRFDQILNSPDSLSQASARLHAEAKSLPRSAKQQAVSDKAAQADVDAQVLKWASSPRLQPPK